jgi:hypothetical protein
VANIGGLTPEHAAAFEGGRGVSLCVFALLWPRCRGAGVDRFKQWRQHGQC